MMGEVEKVSAEEPKSPKVNGDSNGDHEDDIMEVDNSLPDPSELKKGLQNKGNENGKTNGNLLVEEIVAMEVDKPNKPVNGDSNDDEPALSLNEDSCEANDINEVSPLNGSHKIDISSKKLDQLDESKKEDSAVILSDSEDEGGQDEEDRLRGSDESGDSDNGLTSGATSTNPSKIDADEKPVSIHSDSEEEESMPEKANGKQSSESDDASTDKDDCIVIDDDDKKDVPDSPRQTSQRPRKSHVTVREFTTFDDDIEEIVDDPLDMPDAKRAKLNDSIDLTSKKAGNSSGSGRKEPSLVLIDTDTIMGRNSGQQPMNLTTSRSNNSQALNLSAKGTSGQSVLNPFAAVNSQSNLLPNLTDDMFVLEAPSFIVPYIYEKPPTTNLKEIVSKLGVELEKNKKKSKIIEDESSLDGSLNSEKSRRNLIAAAVARATSPVEEEKSKKGKGKRKKPSGDESWDEYDTSSDDEASDSEKRTKVLIKEAAPDIEAIKTHIISPESVNDSIIGENKSDSYFDSPLGKFFMTIGVNLVQEYVQSDLLRQQRRKREREGEEPSAGTQMAINSLMKNLEMSRENNAPFKHKMKRCEFCSFKTESALIMSQHYETPHLRNNVYKCNYCSFEARPAHEILYHMEAIHNIKGRLEKPLSYHQCPNCTFEDNGKSKLARHDVACAKKFKPESNLSAPIDWEPPAKIPRIKAKHGLVGAATAYQAMAAQQQQRLAAAASANVNNASRNKAAIAAFNAMRNRGRPNTVTKNTPGGTVLQNSQYNKSMNAGMMLSNNYQMAAAQLAAANSQLLQQVVAQKIAMFNNSATSAFLPQLGNQSKSKNSTQPSISITPLPRQSSSSLTVNKVPQAGIKPGQSPNANSKAQFVICEICDGYIKDLDQLRNHMQWIHKVKIHPKMIYNRPPLNCQKCQFRFFTDQGLERHLLGSHGLVTSSMQEAANKGKDSGRCPVCGKVYQWKLLNHVSRDHNMTLKPAHLSYKCTVCTATFGMYKQFESHVYSAHSTVAKKDNKGKGATSSPATSTSSSSLLKPLKINDEITIIPQPANKMRGGSRVNEMESHVID